MLSIFRPATGFPSQSSSGLSAGSQSSREVRSGWKWNLRIQSEQPDVESDNRPVSTVRNTKMARLEAVLMVANGPLSLRKLCQFATLADNGEVRKLIDELNWAYDADGSAYRIEQVATGHQLLTHKRFSFWLNRMHQRQASLKLSPAAMETLTIVAYRQPITRADVESIRGVQSSEMLKQLLERKLIRVAGEEDSLGRPYLYGTTRQFLEVFGVHSLSDLPMADSLLQSAKAKRAEAEPVELVVAEPDESRQEGGEDLDDEIDDEIEDEEYDDEYDEDDFDEDDFEDAA